MSTPPAGGPLFVRVMLRGFVPSAGVLHTMPSRSLVLVIINIEEGMPGRGTEHPRAFALAPGGDSGAVPTARPFERGRNGHSKRTSAQTTLRLYASISMADCTRN